MFSALPVGEFRELAGPETLPRYRMTLWTKQLHGRLCKLGHFWQLLEEAGQVVRHLLTMA